MLRSKQVYYAIYCASDCLYMMLQTYSSKIKYSHIVPTDSTTSLRTSILPKYPVKWSRGSSTSSNTLLDAVLHSQIVNSRMPLLSLSLWFPRQMFVLNCLAWLNCMTLNYKSLFEVTLEYLPHCTWCNQFISSNDMWCDILIALCYT